MPHWKLTLSYNGSQFHGWQIQPGLATVQGMLAEALTGLTGELVLPQGAGRTDAGVHALAQVASFSLKAPIPPSNLQRALNRVFPPELRVLEAALVPSSFHARHSARRKLYEYRLFERQIASPDQAAPPERICSPFLAPFVWDCRWPLRLDLLQRAAAMVEGMHDFSAMAATGREPRSEPNASATQRSSKPNPVKTIFRSEWLRRDGLLVYRVAGSGFLHHMVRNLVGTMVDIGRGSLPVDELPRILASRDRAQAGPTAPASGLYLVEVGYEPLPAPEDQATHAAEDQQPAYRSEPTGKATLAERSPVGAGA